jgi:malonyl-CoA/methylmalonyl-CoA synthetase
MEGVVESAVVGVPHAEFGEAVTAIVVPEPGTALWEEQIISALKAKIANFKVPKRVFFLADLPRNTMGKVQKKMLRDQFKPE